MRRARHLRVACCQVFLLLAAASARPEHRETWVEVQSPHFTVYSNAGERDGRRVAAEFEQIRAMFEQSFPKLRVDSGGKPTIVYALRNEESLKLLIPNYGQDKNAIKIAGQYHATYDKNFAIVRTDVTGTGSNAYHVLYHEYAHGLFRLNFRGLPLWLDEGLAEYWGASDIQNKEAHAGMADPRQIRVLKEHPLLPIATLVSIDGTSPLYNTQEHSGIFYAESWALVHYLSMAPEMREQNLLNKYLAALQRTDEPIEAATTTFGDLNGLSEKLEQYVHNQEFFYNRVTLNSEISEKTFTARTLSPAEGLVRQAEYLLHSSHLPEAIELLHEAQALDARASGLHDALGYYHFLKGDYDNAEKEFALELEANPRDASVYLYRASSLYRRNGYSRDTTPQIIANLEKVLELQPDFAPAHAFLCMAYIATPDQKSKAIAAAKSALDLEPGKMDYYLDYGRALLANGKQAEAKQVAARAERSAIWPRDRTLAVNFMRATTNNLAVAKTGAAGTDDAAGGTSAAAAGDESIDRRTEKTSLAAGKITELNCGHPPAVMFTLATENEQFLFHAKDIGKVALKDSVPASASGPANCAAWKDRNAKVSYQLTPDGPAHGEMTAISFEQ